ncbi:MerR family transcriptional regulator [Virgibacillus soli]|uniref:MerR family transcriptional regulator n=1 Tax=Paracerasibacillus soli TaxID=480284 RepID=A0ABU5CMA7_9BACI|nr:MerR family transcriptional regulator [Virgibacillus soli]MDY0407476.1 MerR family transcriptional regulator [Virgibacillus soli]
MLVKEFALKYHVTSDTVRYYEKEGLLQPQRLENGYRFYDEQCEKSIKYIMVLKQMGFSLQEIQQLLQLGNSPITEACNRMSTTLFENKVMHIKQKIDFFTSALEVLQVVLELTSEGRYSENQSRIDNLVDHMYQKLVDVK